MEHKKQDYANRNNELSEIQQAFQSDIRMIFIDTYKASGASSFILEKVKPSLSVDNRDFIYLDMKNEYSLSNALYSYLASGKYSQHSQELADEYLGSKKGSLSSAILNSSNYGVVLDYAISKKMALPVYSGNYSTAFEELLVPFFERYTPKNGFIIILDSMENLDDSSHEVLVTLSRFNITFFMIKSENSNQYTKLKNTLDKCTIASKEVLFPAPYVELVKEIAHFLNFNITRTDAESILWETKNNIHGIMTYFNELKNSKPLSLDENEKRILLMMSILEEPISQLELCNIILSSELFVFSKQKHNRTIKKLTEKKLIEVTESVMFLKHHNHPLVLEVMSSQADRLLYSSIIYDYLKKSDKRNISLRYKLGEILGYSNSYDAKLFLVHSYTAGVSVSQEVFLASKLEKGNHYDCVLAAIYFTKKKEYGKALDWVQSVPIKERDSTLGILNAILLNSTRKLDEARPQILECISLVTNIGIKNLLYSYLISNYIHSEMLEDATRLYEINAVDYANTPMHGYFLRNSASIFSFGRQEIYDQALMCFINDNDHFGVFSAQCNKAIFMCTEGNPKEALELINRAQMDFGEIPKEHAHILENNLGICNMFLKNFDEANKGFLYAERFYKSLMSKYFAKINRACLYAIMKRKNEALQMIRDLESEIIIHSLDRVRQKYYHNKLLIEYLCGENDLESSIKETSEYPDRYYPNKTKELIQVCTDFLNSNKRKSISWEELISPCVLVYWYMDPLKFLSISNIDHFLTE